MFQNLKNALSVLFFGLQVPDPQVIEVTSYKVIEVKAPRTITAWTKETKDAVGTLAAHPGFVALTDRLNLQRQMLENKLSREYHKDLREIDYLQAGVFWLGYIQDTVAKATKLVPPTPTAAFDEELEAFKLLDAQIERIGMEPEPQA